MSRTRRILAAFVVGAALSLFAAAPALANCIEHAVCYGQLDTAECHFVLGR